MNTNDKLPPSDSTEANTAAGGDCVSRLVRLGAEYTQLHMHEVERRSAIQSAHWRMCSPHEWEWTPEEQSRMAYYVLWASQRLEMISVLSLGGAVIHEPNS